MYAKAQLSLANRIVLAIADVTGDSDFDGMSVAGRAEQLLAVAEKKNTLTAVTGEFSPVRPERWTRKPSPYHHYVAMHSCLRCDLS